MDETRAMAVVGCLLAACSGGGGDAAIDAAAPPWDAAVDAVVDARAPVDFSEPTVPVSELLFDTYKGLEGGLYPDRQNQPPDAHARAGQARAAAIVPRDLTGAPSPTGRYVLLSMGMSNTTQEWCGAARPPCVRPSFMAKAAADPAVDHDRLAIVNGAAGGQTCTTWDEPTEANYDRVRDLLADQGLSEAQVQVLWLKCANARPTMELPSPMSHAHQVERGVGAIARAARARYPNLQLIFVSNRIYAGYATTTLNPEPHAYETGFGVKWAVEAQIRQRETGVVDPEAGDLRPTVAPWLGWGPDLWANGTTPRADGLTYERTDLQDDGTHPSLDGVDKVSDLLLAHFKTSPLARCWFLAGERCTPP